MHPRPEAKQNKRHSYSSVRTSYFAVRVINVWNTLPVDRVDFSCFAAFKRTLQQIDFSMFFYYATRLMFILGGGSVTRDLIIQFTHVY